MKEKPWKSYHLNLLQKGPQAFFPCVIIVQARMGSERLPKKVMMPILGKPILELLVERLRAVRHVDALTIATTTQSLDDSIYTFCLENNLHAFRGDEEDVLSRFYQCAKSFDAEVVVRITADCPLIDPQILSSALYLFRQKFDELDYLSNTLERTFARGMDIEIMRMSVLEEAYFHAKSQHEREHVTPFIVKNGDTFRLGNFFTEKRSDDMRLTLDTKEDFTLIENIFSALNPKGSLFSLEDIRQYMDEHPELKKINENVEQKHY